MPPEKRPVKFHISLSTEEKEQVCRMAAENHLSMAELFRAKTLKHRLPRRVTQIAGLTYWELTQISSALSQIAEAIATPSSQHPVVVVDQKLLNQTVALLSQVRRELTDLDYTPEVEDEP
jgi:hypothetical protein